eukprot:CAMPEP_0194212710 /NCGR_PEP_ID=MMETSP0156-20130528/12747_1 /TAXON_ID=33649 /ORGANISM="Thalassionema nitzschioides, Strain L26-B" /LENGTH=662 /DNA_ID=CAMNT_0038940583 /DNA_START=83 /DNA_END=2071 /DNA_ORIENTATION=+
MSNPFDQFSSDVKAALPGGPPPGAAPDAFAPYPAPAAPSPARPQQSVMNAPPQQTYPSNGYGAPQMNGYGVPAPPQNANPFDMPPQQPPQAPSQQIHRQPSQEQQADQNPFGAPEQQMIPAGQPSNSYGMPPGPHLPAAGGPFGPPPTGPPGPPPPGPPPSDPWGSSMPPPQHPPQPPEGDMFGGGALVPAQRGPPPGGDPFSVFNATPAQPPMPPSGPPAPVGGDMFGAPPPPSPARQQNPGAGDIFGEMGLGAAPAPLPSGSGPQPTNSDGIFEAPVQATEPGQHKEGELPPGGEWYDARIFTPTLGVMFFKPQELTDSLFLNTDKEIVDALEERPVVAFIVEGSSARSAGVELGHVLLKVNGVDVKNPKEASRLIKEGPRPLPLLFYVPNTEVIVAEGEHMVKYDTRDTTAPNSAKDWKPKYVVIGGIIAQPWMMNMYRSKSEYDIAVIETQARRPVSVKVKQFSLQGARVQNDWQGPQMVKYKNKLHPWKYIVILPVARNPIKISSPNLSQLKPVHEGIRRVLLSQQRDRGSNPNSAGPVRQRSGPQSSYDNGPSRQDPYRSAPPPAQAQAPPLPPTQDLIGGFDDPPQQPPQNYGAPPPQQPPQNYGAPPPQPGYGAPPPQPGYGAPPPQYGAPPPQYGAPPPQQPPQQNYAQQPYF